MSKDKLDIYDKLLTISTSVNLGYLHEINLQVIRNKLLDLVIDYYSTYFNEMSYSELADFVANESHTAITNWSFGDLCSHVIDDFSNWCQTEDEIADNPDLQELERLIHEAISPIEWTKLIGKLKEQGIKYYYE